MSWAAGLFGLGLGMLIGWIIRDEAGKEQEDDEETICDWIDEQHHRLNQERAAECHGRICLHWRDYLRRDLRQDEGT